MIDDEQSCDKATTYECTIAIVLTIDSAMQWQWHETLTAVGLIAAVSTVAVPPTQ